MRLPEIFDFRQFPIAESQKFSENLPDFPGIKFRKNVPECTGNVPVFLTNVENVPEFLTNVKNVENNHQFSRFSTFLVHSGTFLALKMVTTGVPRCIPKLRLRNLVNSC